MNLLTRRDSRELIQQNTIHHHLPASQAQRSRVRTLLLPCDEQGPVPCRQKRTKPYIGTREATWVYWRRPTRSGTRSIHARTAGKGASCSSMLGPCAACAHHVRTVEPLQSILSGHVLRLRKATCRPCDGLLCKVKGMNETGDAFDAGMKGHQHRALVGWKRRRGKRLWKGGTQAQQAYLNTVRALVRLDMET